MAKTTTPGLEPIDRLEEKIKLLVSTIGRLKGEQGRLTEENARLGREVETLQARLSDAQGETAELSSLRDERDVIRTRVSEMLQQLESLSL
ncbi:MAG: cell division protein ZapB [Vicinamibacterales bacterium]|nr:cell division protein ZapB [Vicinamibacterales bacterium]